MYQEGNPGETKKLANYDLEIDVIKRRGIHEDFVVVASGCLHLKLAWNDLTLQMPPEIRRKRGGRGGGVGDGGGAGDGRGDGGGVSGGGGSGGDLESRLADLSNTLPRSVVAKICRSLSIEEKCSQGACEGACVRVLETVGR